MGKKNRVKKRDQLKRFEGVMAKLPDEFHDIAMTVDDPIDGMKMSEVLLVFLEPYTKGMEGEKQWNAALRLGVIAWNAALLPPHAFKEGLDNTLTTFPDAEGEKIVALLKQMVLRKLSFFAHDKRFIVEYHYSERKDGPFLSVVSQEVP